MKRTQITDLIANIKATFVSFFSILMFVMLGVGVFLGISWAGPALQNAAESMFNEGTFHNLQIQYPFGLTDDDLKKLSEVDGVSEVEAERQSYQTMQVDNRKRTVKVQSLGQSINTPIIVEGELPANADEIAFHAESARLLGVSVGDTVTFEKDADEGSSDAENDNDSGMEYLSRGTFTVTALVNSADYIADASETYGFSSSPSGAVDGLAWVVDDVFDASAFHDGYPIVNIRCSSLNGIATFSDQYKAASKEIEERVADLGETLSEKRFEELHDDAEKKIDDAQKKLDDARKEVADGEKKIEDAKKDIADGEKKIADGEAQIADGYEKIADGKSELEKAQKEFESKKAKAQKGLKAGEEYYKELEEDYEKEAAKYQAEKDKNDALQAAYNKARKELESAQAAYTSAKEKRQEYENQNPEPRTQEQEAELTELKAKETAAEKRLDAAQSATINVNGTSMSLDQASQAAAASAAALSVSKKNLDAKKADLDDGKELLDEAWAVYDKEVGSAQKKIDNAKARINDAQAKISQGEIDLENAKRELEDGKKELKDKEKELKDAKKELRDKEKQLDDARHDLDLMKSSSWTVSPRAYNAGAGEITTFSDVTNNLSISMAALFIIVGLLVSYFAVSRIVNEQITQIGTKKALGFRRGEVTASYLWYSGIAVVAGSILGGVIAYFIVEGIIGGVLADMFAFGPYPAFFGWGLFLIITAIELVLVLGATYLACRKILKEHAVELLRGPEPPAAKTHFYEKWGIWEKLPLFIQTIVNNCVNDKRRVLSTIVGVAGCTALIVTAITLNNDVMKSYDRHYENVYGFNTIAYVDSDVEDAIGDVESAFNQRDAMTVQAFEKHYLMEQPNGESGSMHIVVPVDEEAFSHVYSVNPITDGAFDLSAEGAWVSQAYAEHFGVKAGDVITIEEVDGTKHEIPILGFYEFWLTYHEMVMGKGYYEKEFGAKLAPNAVLGQVEGGSIDEIEQEISGIEGYDSIIADAAKQYENFETFSAVSQAVVIIYLVLATLMAIVVLLNLNVMFIEEKKRELIVLMINGFSVKDARHYISYDNIVLTALGIIVGLILGCITGSITVASIEPVTGVFVKSVDGWAVIIGILGSVLLAVIMSLIALRRINKFKLTDINRF